MGSFSIWHWLIVLVVVLLLFGRGKIPELMGDVAKGIKNFKKGMSDEEAASAENGKTVEHNLQILAGLDRFHTLGVAVAVGLSRKGFIAKLSRGEPPKDRAAGSIAGALAAVARGVHIVRVHDVALTRQALAVWQAVEAARPS